MAVLQTSIAANTRALRRLDGAALSVWALAATLMVYLGVEGGGYDIVVRSQVAVVVWWVVLIGAAWGVLPAGRLSRAGWAGLALFGAFVAWTALASTWSQSSERSLEELSRVACYLGILLLALAVHRDRATAVRHTVHAVATAIVAVAVLALSSRLVPGLFPAASQTPAFLHGVANRLSWPLNYWNALAALLALGLPLLLGIAGSARTAYARAAAAGAIPALALCGYLTFSRGGAIAAAVAGVVFLALDHERIPKLATALVAASGSAALIVFAVHDSAIERGLTNATASHEGSVLLLAMIVVCAAVAALQTAIVHAVRHGSAPLALTISVRNARRLLAVGAAISVAAAALAGVPAAIANGWQEFKHPAPAILHQDSIGRFATVSGNGRYDYWTAALAATGGRRLLTGNGPGTFALIWLPRAPYTSYVQNAHSLYVETLSDVGLIGLAVLVGFLALGLGAGMRAVVRARDDARTRAAGLTAALVAFCVSAAFDWIWQVPVLPAAFLLLAAAALAPGARRPAPAKVRFRAVRVGIGAVAVACLIAIVVPLATTEELRSSQAASAGGNQTLALADARAAARIEPGAASPQIQTALVQEQQGRPQAALLAARRAAADEPENWSTWLIVSRLEAETGHPGQALAAFTRARSLNPNSSVFR